MRGGAAGPSRAELSEHAAWKEADTCSRTNTVLLVIPLSPSSPRSPPKAMGRDRIQSPGVQGNTKNVSRTAFSVAFL